MKTAKTVPDPEIQYHRCGSCDALIFWTQTIYGRRMPLDAEPSPNGDFWIEKKTKPPTAVMWLPLRDGGPGVPPPEPRFKTHFETCPDAANWRKRGWKKGPKK